MMTEIAQWISKATTWLVNLITFWKDWDAVSTYFFIGLLIFIIFVIYALKRMENEENKLEKRRIKW